VDAPAGAAPALWVICPPAGVRLLSSRPSRTGEGGRGVIARYSDGTTASAMANSDGSLCVLFFRGGEGVPALPLAAAEGGPPRFTWAAAPPKPRGR
jgi:hypothetical protein